MWDSTAESGAPRAKCERAEYLEEGQDVKMAFARFCLRSPQILEDPALHARVTAEAELAGEAAKEARQIVEACTGCDGNGVRVEGVNHCPGQTVERVEGWARKVIPVALFAEGEATQGRPLR